MRTPPQNQWVNDGHRAHVWHDDGGFDVDFVHAMECPYEDRPYPNGLVAYTIRHYLCPLEYELENVGLSHPFKDNHGCVNHDEEIPDDAWEAFFRARLGGDGFAVEYYYSAGWTPSTPAGPSEYDWYFVWRPVELGRLVHGHTH